MARTWTCPVCKETIVGAREVVGHEKRLRNGECLPCQPIPVITVPEKPEKVPELMEPMITEAEVCQPKVQTLFCRRNMDVVAKDRPRVVTQKGTLNKMEVCDFCPLQDEWDALLSNVNELYDEQFWTFYLELHQQSAVAIDAAIRGARKAFNMRNLKFAGSKKTMMRKIKRHVAPFFDRIMHVELIDLRKFGVSFKLPFRFLDPVWAWIVAANKLPPAELNWIPRVMTNASGKRLYGAGVQYGESFAQAFASCPPAAFPMLYNVHWDGTSAHGLAAVPVVVAVSNFNGQSTDAHTCIGYLPTLDEKLFASSKATAVKFHIRQQCLGAIFAVLETYATTGVRCRMPGPHGSLFTRVLFPRLMATSLDQPERQLYYGQLNRTSCIHCKRRKGRSAQRKAGKQSGQMIQTLYNILEDTTVDEVCFFYTSTSGFENTCN